MVQTWGLTYSKDGTEIGLYEVPLWAFLLMEASDWVLSATHPVLCCADNSWAYRIAWAPADEEPDEEGYAYNAHSLGHALHMVGQQLGGGFGTYRKFETKARIPVTPEWVREHFPDAGWPFDGSSGDEMHAAPGDNGDMQL